MRTTSRSDLERELVALQSLKTPALQSRWREVFGTKPPRKMRAGFLQRALAYRLQEQVMGGLRPETQRLLQRQARAMSPTGAEVAPKGPAQPTKTLTSGTRLMREWNGTTELVDVVEDGFVWRNQRYRTLSSVAVAITGTKWSGPKFFGLDRPSPLAKRSQPKSHCAPANVGAD